MKKYRIEIDSENSPGTLYRIAGMFLRKKINIETLFVKETNAEKHISHFTIEILLEDGLIEKLIRQIDRIIEVIEVKYEIAK